MKLNKKIILASLFALAFASYTFAQVKVSLTIQANVQNAQVYIDDNLAGYASPNLSLLIFPGTYTIRVVKNGYQE
ncbi:MAG TPA: PEGA domain-containing protein, partial [Rectinema sp.]|nr:PEGA domain-containing protein [Rectinema sp.]